MKHLIIACCLLSLWLTACQEHSTISKPQGLSCEYMANPAVVDETQPRLSWIDMPRQADARNIAQSAYQILVASTPERLNEQDADLWNSGKVNSDQTYLVQYAGKALQSGMDCWWKVRVWDRNDKATAWSKPAVWHMGLLNASDWKAKWIGAPWQADSANASYTNAPMLRKSFTLKGKVKRAKVYISGLGYYELYVNGQKMGDELLASHYTNYTERPELSTKPDITIEARFRQHRVPYMMYDVTHALRRGDNMMGVLLGNGFYNTRTRWVMAFGSPRLLCQMEIEYANGEHETLVSDESWQAKTSAIVLNDVYHGEVYDARLETPGWCDAKNNAGQWENATLRQTPTGVMSAQTAPADRILETLKPISLKQTDDLRYEVDFGKEVSGWIALTNLKGQAGDTVKVDYICESKQGIQHYIMKGDAQGESYAPRFTWFVFSKAIISGVSHLESNQLTAMSVGTDVKRTATWASSDTLINRINEIWQQSQIDNMHGCIASDCPHRERSPYTGDGQVSCTMVMHNFDAAAFYKKWIRDMNDAQDPLTGYVPNGAPWQPGCGGGVPWGAAMNIIPWEFYRQYADMDLLRRNYEAMKMQVDYMLTWRTPQGTMFAKRTNVDGTPQYWLNLGEWVPPYELPADELVHTFYLWYCLDIQRKAALALQKADDASHYEALAHEVANAFHTKFYDAEAQSYGDFGSNVFALVMGVPADREANVVSSLRHEIAEKYHKHLNTGIFGTRFLFEVLAEHGMADLAMEVMTQRDFPSYGYWIAQGATVTWEQWDGHNSRNHPMFGGGLVWLYRNVAGVNIDEAQPGYKHIIFRPTPTTLLTTATYGNQTPYGQVKATVCYANPQTMTYEVTVPVGCTGTVYLPQSATSTLTENNKPMEEGQAGIRSCTIADGQYVIEIAQGSYRFDLNNL